MADIEQLRKNMIARFRSVGAERVRTLNRLWLHVEQHPDDAESIKALLREIHTVKGEARLMGLEVLHKVAHRTEDALHHARASKFRAPEAVADAVLRGFDLLGAGMTDDSAIDFDAYSSMVDAALKAEHEAPVAEPPVVETQPAETIATAPDLSATAGFLHVGIHRLDLLTELSSTLRMRHRAQLNLLVAIEHAHRELASMVDRARAALHDREADTRAATQARTFLADGHTAAHDLGRRLLELREAGVSFALRCDELDETVRELRFLPVARLFDPVRRAARDLSRAQGKRVAVVTSGETIEIDKQVLDLLVEPMIHLVRNAIDHGIGPPTERSAQGRPPEATLSLDARLVGSSVEIRVKDDGRGLDEGAIRRAAVARGMLNSDEAREIDRAGLMKLIFKSQFSTRSEVTDVSGRGVGLDAVKSATERLGGVVVATSDFATWTCFTIQVPASRMLGRAMLVEVGGEVSALPSSAVLAGIDLGDHVPRSDAHGSVIEFRDQPVRLFNLGDLLGLRSAGDGDGRAVVVEANNHRIAVRVDRIVGEQQIVVRPADPFVRSLRLLESTAILPSGELAPVLDVAELIREATVRASWVAPARGASDQGPATILVVDDSEFTRDVVSRLFREMGYRVVEAVDGNQALARLEEGRPDLVFTDLEMPGLDGFGFLRRMRARPECRELPAVVFSTLGSDADKQRAIDAGADAYLVKSTFREEDFARIAERFLGSGTP